MKVVCKVNDISTLTYLKVYEVIDDLSSTNPAGFYHGNPGYIIIDDFENNQFYYAGYFMSIDESRDLKIDLIFKN
ncbi:MAG TPA: hypothetical protein PLC25_03550 [Bacilli bacterium]|nr:hypothetical protein [Bacilli bacterium]